MKYLLSLLLSAVSILAIAQKNENHRLKYNNDFTSEQQAILKTKKMDLALDLNDTQENQILALNKKQAEIRKNRIENHRSIKGSGNKPTSDERFKMLDEMLDSQLAYQNEIKKILKSDQYLEFKQMQKNKMMRMHKKGMQHKNKGNNSKKS